MLISHINSLGPMYSNRKGRGNEKLIMITAYGKIEGKKGWQKCLIKTNRAQLKGMHWLAN